VDFYRRPVRREGLRAASDQGRHAFVRGRDRPRSGGHLVATLKGIATREDAERLNGVELYVAREKLPATDENEYYHADLIGLAAVNAANEPLGRVIAIHNFGAGDIIEIAPPQGSTMLLPFTNAVVPTIDLKGGRVVIELPNEIAGDEASI
jgi:16S rRNA processing protein RimM